MFPLIFFSPEHIFPATPPEISVPPDELNAGDMCFPANWHTRVTTVIREYRSCIDSIYALAVLLPWTIEKQHNNDYTTR